MKKIHLLIIALLFALVTPGRAALNIVNLYTPPASVAFAQNPRVVQMPNGTLIATFALTDAGWDNRVYRSKDGGKTWTQVTTVPNLHTSSTKPCAPDLYVMPITIGSLAAGTLLFAATIGDGNGGTYIDLYKSTNEGTSWSFVGTVVHDPGPDPDLWEPFMWVDTSNRLLCYYADESDPSHSQKIACRVWNSSNNTWGSTLNVTASPTYNHRPGMPRITKMGNGQHMLTYEIIGINGGQVYFKTSTDGFNWSGGVASLGTAISAVDGSYPKQCPSVAWTPAGSAKGTVIVSSMNQSLATSRGTDNYVNYNYGVGSWYRVQQPLAYNTSRGTNPGWSRVVTPSLDGHTLYHINCVDLNDTQNKIVFASTPAAYTPGFTYKIVNKNSRKLLGIEGCSLSDLADADQWDDNGATCQRWRIQITGNSGYVKILNGNSGKALDILYGSTADGAKAIQWPSSAATSQQWQVIPNGDGLYKLKNVNSGKLLRIVNCSTGNGALADQWADNGSACQLWQLQYIDDNAPGVLANGLYRITARHSGKVVDVPSPVNGTVAHQWGYWGGANQKWQVTHLGEGKYHMRSLQSGRLLSAYAGNDVFINNELVDNPIHKWTITAVSGYFRAVNLAMGTSMEVDGALLTDGTRIKHRTWTGGNHQQWTFSSP